jgi:hypothetical protein
MLPSARDNEGHCQWVLSGCSVIYRPPRMARMSGLCAGVVIVLIDSFLPSRGGDEKGGTTTCIRIFTCCRDQTQCTYYIYSHTRSFPNRATRNPTFNTKDSSSSIVHIVHNTLQIQIQSPPRLITSLFLTSRRLLYPFPS